MKVLCIEDRWRHLLGKVPPISPVVNQTYFVTDIASHDGFTVYELAGLGKGRYFDSAGFLPLSDIDGVEILRADPKLPEDFCSDYLARVCKADYLIL